MDSAAPTSLRELARRYTSGQRRTVDVALDLFARFGVDGTSLQMIADGLGVTKAAIYHQFRTKDAIVIAVLEIAMQSLEAALDDYEADPTPNGRQVLLWHLIDAAVDRRRALTTLQHDPVIVRLLSDHDASRHLWRRLFAALAGGDDDARTTVRAAVLSTAMTAAAHPFTVGLDDETVRLELRRITEQLVSEPAGTERR